MFDMLLHVLAIRVGDTICWRPLPICTTVFVIAPMFVPPKRGAARAGAAAARSRGGRMSRTYAFGKWDHLAFIFCGFL